LHDPILFHKQARARRSLWKRNPASRISARHSHEMRSTRARRRGGRRAQSLPQLCALSAPGRAAVSAALRSRRPGGSSGWGGGLKPVPRHRGGLQSRAHNTSALCALPPRTAPRHAALLGGAHGSDHRGVVHPLIPCRSLEPTEFLSVARHLPILRMALAMTFRISFGSVSAAMPPAGSSHLCRLQSENLRLRLMQFLRQPLPLQQSR
jgi:hypothetical protein